MKLRDTKLNMFREKIAKLQARKLINTKSRKVITSGERKEIREHNIRD